ncbi:MAG: helix-turn-helix transcriptional regulator [bacterium]|nr:helix-turn-helix transcriptional regulator [bacterium]
MTKESKIEDRLKTIRQELGLTQYEFAQRLGISPPGLSEMENGKYKPNMDVAARLAVQFNVNLYYLILGEGEMFAGDKEHPHKDIVSDLLDNLKVDKEEFLNLLSHLERSPYLQFAMLSSFWTYMTKESDTIRNDLETYEKKRTGESESEE